MDPADTLNFPLIQKLMATTGRIGAFCLGTFSGLAMHSGDHFPDAVYERAAQCHTLAELDELLQEIRTDTPESAGRKAAAARQFFNLFSDRNRAG